MDRGTFTCLGLGTSLGQKMTYDVVCEVVAPDGGKILSTFTRGHDGKITREMVAGTGRYEGIVASGIVEATGDVSNHKAWNVSELQSPNWYL